VNNWIDECIFHSSNNTAEKTSLRRKIAGSGETADRRNRN